ncbi:CynX/NimT family MFS transporter [Bowdeniella massiliensis]|uniref:CynX/NimT family MFS transporter n=1 Tax=Bowdeniella massiliensis TaxID=2932264 RepID=UPI0020297B01|nr:MFS transporter [Bowdeniella massiliensis]
MTSPRFGLPKSPHGAYAWLLLSAVALLALNLRAGATSIGPLLAEIQAGLHLSDSAAGILTALPGFVFAATGLFAVAVSTRFGLHRALGLIMSAVFIGLAARPFVPLPLFFAFTILCLAGMAMGNVLAPVFVKLHFPNRIGAMMTLYTTCLAIGATIPTAVSQPLANLLPGGWRSALAFWAIFALCAMAVLLAVIVRRDPRGVRIKARGSSLIGAVARSPKARWISLFFGLQSMNAYVQFGWAAQIYRDAGLDPVTAGWMLTIIAGMGIPGGLIAPVLATRLTDLRPLVLSLAALLAVGYLGLYFMPTTAPWLWALALGISGFCFPLTITLISIRSRHVDVTAGLSAFAQSIGYLAAGLGPLIIGVLVDVTGGWQVPLIVLTCGAVGLAIAGINASAPGDVDDDLGAIAAPR